MIIRHEELVIAARLRASIIALLGGVHDASGLLPYGDPSPNWSTKRRIEEVAAGLKSDLISLGAIPIEMHGECGRPEHAEKSSSVGPGVGYWCIVVPGRDQKMVEPVQDGSGILTIQGQLYTTHLFDAVEFIDQTRKGCPCSLFGRQEEHSIARHIAWPRDPESRLGELASLHKQLRLAARASEDRQRRSSIREELLRALLEVERLVLPLTAEEYLAEQLDGCGEPRVVTTVSR